MFIKKDDSIVNLDRVEEIRFLAREFKIMYIFSNSNTSHTFSDKDEFEKACAKLSIGTVNFKTN